jgi:hypothetical protein
MPDCNVVALSDATQLTSNLIHNYGVSIDSKML